MSELPAGTARLLLALILGLMLCATAPVVAGWRSGVVLTGSMSPALDPGDVVLSRPVPGRMPRPGQVIAVRDPLRPGRVLVHRLVTIDRSGRLVTKGDANAVADSTPVPPAGLIGEVRVRVPKVGLPAVWLRRREPGKVLLSAGALIGLGLLATRPGQPTRPRDPGQPRMPERPPWHQETGPVRHATRHRTGRPRASGRRPRQTVTAACVLVTLLLAVTLDRSGTGYLAAGFTDSTTNPGNSFNARATFERYRQAVMADSPLAYFRADDPAGSTVAADSSAQHADGRYANVSNAFQVAGSPASGSGPGAGSAVRFPGAAHASAASNATLTNPNTFTSEIWFRTTSQAGSRFFGLGDAATGSSFFTDRRLSMFGNGAVQFAAGTGSIQSGTGYNDGAWHLATASLGPAGMRLYLDGTLVAAAPGTTTGENYTGYWRIGGDNFYFDGTLDEAAIYLSQLSDARVSAHHAAGRAATSVADYTAAVSADSPWALWHLDDPAASSYPGNVYDTVMADSSGQGRAGVYHQLPPVGLLAGGPGALTGTGAAGTSVNYRRSGTGYLPAARPGPAAFSVELWFRSNGPGGELIGFGSSPTGSSPGHDRMVYLRDDGRLNFGVYSGGTVTLSSPAAYADGAWHHVVATNGPAGMALHVDGTQVAAGPVPGPPDVGIGYWRWGGDSLSGWPNRPARDFFGGDLDEVAIYPGQLSAAQAAAHYAANV